MKYGGNYLKTNLLPDGSIAQIKADVTVSYQEITPLCVKDNGSLVTPDSFKYCARVIHMELGNVLFHAHCLRHTHGTILAENGVNPKTVMERLGIRIYRQHFVHIRLILKLCNRPLLMFLSRQFNKYKKRLSNSSWFREFNRFPY